MLARKHQHITDLRHLTDSPFRSWDVDSDIDSDIDSDVDSDAAYENEGDVLEARRVPKPLPRRSKQHITEPASPDRPTAGEGPTHTGRALADAVDGELNGGAHGNAHEQKNTHQTKKKPVQEGWGFSVLCGNGPTHLVLLDGAPGFLRPVTASSSRIAPMRKLQIKGAAKPIDTLRSHDGPRTSNLDPKKPPPFDLKNGQYHPDGDHDDKPKERARKRQRTDDGSTSRHTSSHEVIDLEDDSSIYQSNRSLTVPRSGVSKNQHEQQRLQSKRPPRRGSGSSDAPGGRGTGDDMLRKQAAAKQKDDRIPVPTSQSLHEDPHDPIVSDHEDRKPPKKAKFQVEIVTSSYHGTAHHRPARIKQNGNSKGPAETNKRSSYFPQPNADPYEPRQAGKLPAVAVDEQAWEDQALGKMRSSKRTSKSKNSSCPSNASYGDESSLYHLAGGHDELSTEDNAQILSAAQKKSVSHQSTPARLDVDVVPIDESDDELATQNANINPTKFVSKASSAASRSKYPRPGSTKSTNKAQLSKTGVEKRYGVVQVFTQFNNWHDDPHGSKWRLVHSHDQACLRFYDSKGDFEFDIMTSSIQKIQYAERSAKLIIHKSADMTSARKGSSLYLELEDADQAFRLLEDLQRIDATIKSIEATDDHFGKVFKNHRNRTAQPKGKTHDPMEGADVQLAIKKQERRDQQRFDNALGIRGKNAQSASNIESSDDTKQTQRAGGLSKKMQASATQDRSPTEISDNEKELPKNPKVRGIPARGFYGSVGADDSIGETHGTWSSTRHNKDSSYQTPPKPRSPSPVLGWTKLNPDWGESWHSSVVFAGDGNARATIEKIDIPKLDEGEFLNDSLIYFYLLYLQKKLADAQPDIAKRIFVHNSFFYERLTKQPSGKKGFNYDAVRKWTDRAKVDIFTKDYIIVPVNENLHWYVVIICNAPKFLNPQIEIETTPSQDANERLEAQQPENSPITVLLPRSTPPPVSESSVDVGINGLSLADVPDEDNKSSLDRKPDPASAKQTSLKESDGVSIPDVLDDEDEIPLVKSDIIQAPVKAAPTRKKKRVSVSRKYDPAEPRIITLDSFGHSHPPACKNLKEYLIAELEAKHKKDMAPPGNLGMTAKGIPLQGNFSDCGVFLLGYMERFFRDPDDFARCLLQGQQDLTSDEKEWVKAPEIRKSIRDLLFKLQQEQAPASAKNGEHKKRKRAPTSENKPESAAPSKPTSREASKSARASVARDDNELTGVRSDIPRSSHGEPFPKNRPSASPKNARPDRIESFLPENPNREAFKKASAPFAPEVTTSRKEKVIPDSDAEDQEPEVGASLSPVKYTPTRDDYPSEVVARQQQPSGVFNKFTAKWSSYFGKSKQEEQSRPLNFGASPSNPFEIDESPQKQDQQTKHLHLTQNPVVPEADFSRPVSRGRRGSPYPRFPQNTPSPGPDDDSISVDRFEVSSSPGLDEPITNGSKTRTVPDENVIQSKEIDHEDQEMLLLPGAHYSKQHSSGTNSKQYSPQPTSRNTRSPKKRSLSEAPGPSKKRTRARSEDESSSPEYLKTESRQGPSRAVPNGVSGIEQQYADEEAGTARHRWIPAAFEGKHTKFED